MIAIGCPEDCEGQHYPEFPYDEGAGSLFSRVVSLRPIGFCAKKNTQEASAYIVALALLQGETALLGGVATQKLRSSR